MVQKLLNQSACVADLKQRARRRLPGFVWDYVEGGCNNENALKRNREGLDAVCLRPDYLTAYQAPDLKTDLFGKTYQAPFGIAPLGLTGLVWPDASVFHARAARQANIPFILSTLSTTSIETAAAEAEDNLWFQLYPPSDQGIRADLLKRAQVVGCRNLVVTVDVPSAGRRPKDIKSGLSVPPKITVRSVLQAMQRPHWSLATLKAGLPQFASIQPYMKGWANMGDVADFIRIRLKAVVDDALLKSLRDQWQGNLIVKGISDVADAKRALALGADGIIVSNHGGRQLDAAISSIDSLEAITQSVGDKLVVMADSGVESGVDIARFLSRGAQVVFAGRVFLYGVAAHRELGAQHSIDLLQDELQQVMSQLHCASPEQLLQHRIM